MNNIRIANAILKLFMASGLFSQATRDTNLCDQFFVLVNRRQKTRGNRDTVLWLKALRLNLYTFLAGNPIQGTYMSTSSDGLSRAFKGLAQGIRAGDIGSIRLAMSLLMISRVIPLIGQPSTETITRPPGFNQEVMNDFNAYVRDSFPRSLRNLNPQWSNPHLTNKMGPMGRAIQVAVIELRYLPTSLIQAIQTIGGRKLQQYMSRLFQNIPVEVESRATKVDRLGQLRRLSVVNDYEGKARVIAIGDYWSQTCLYPLHEALLKGLRWYKECDVTFGQEIAPFGPHNHRYYSYDLTAATDRIPVQCYEQILDQVYGRKISDAWKELMVAQPFRYRDSVYKYKTGQPMGLYSSWVLLAHFHHLVISYSASLVGIRNFRDYRVLGDDVVIRNDLVAASYLKVMTALGIGISLEKTQVSKDSFEFAKRFFYKGTEVTGIPQNAFITTDWLAITHALLILKVRGYSTYQQASQFIMSLLKITRPDKLFSIKLLSRLARKVMTQQIMRDKSIPEVVRFERIGQLWNKPVSCVNIPSFQKEFYTIYFSNISKDIDEYVAKSMSISYEINRDLMVPFVKGTTDLGPIEYEQPLTQALNESVEVQLQDSSDLNDLVAEASKEGTSITDVQIRWSESKDLRSYDPRVLDPTRKSEKAFVKSSTQLVRTMSQQ